MEYLTELLKHHPKDIIVVLSSNLNRYFSEIIIAPTFEENGIFMLGLVFFIQSVFGKILYPVDDMDTLKSNLKRYFTYNFFVLWV